MASNKKQFDIAIEFATKVKDGNLESQLKDLTQKIADAESKLKINIVDEEATNNLRKYKAQFNTLFSTISDSATKLNQLKSGFDALNQSMSKISRGQGINEYLDKQEQKLSNLSNSIEKYKSKFESLNMEMPKIKKSESIEKQSKAWEHTLKEVANTNKSYDLIKKAVGDKVSISPVDTGKDIGSQIKVWREELKQFGITLKATPTTVWAIESRRALTGLGVEIDTVTQKGVKRVAELSKAGRYLAQVLKDAGDTSFKDLDLKDEPNVLQVFSDRVAQAKLTAYDDKNGRELFKFNILDGMIKETNAADAVLKDFIGKLKSEGATTADEARAVAKKFGMEFKIGDVITDQAKESHAAFQLIKDDLTISGGLSTYTDKITGKKGTSIGTTDTQISYQTNKYVQDYSKLLTDNISLTKEANAEEEKGNLNTADYIRDKIKLNESEITSLEKKIEKSEKFKEVEEDYLRTKKEAVDLQQQQVASQADNTEQAQVDKLIESYKELNKAKYNQYVAENNVNTSGKTQYSSNDDKIKASLDVAKAQEKFNKELGNTNPKLVQSKKYTDAVTKADEDLSDSLGKVDTSIKKNSFSLEHIKTKLSEVISNVIEYQLAWSAIAKASEGVKKSIELIHELDTAMTNIRIVTGQTQEEVRGTINTYAELGKELGSTTREVSSGSIEWLFYLGHVKSL